MGKDKAQAKRGKRGGAVTKELYGLEHYRKISKKRWAKVKKYA